MGKHYGKILGNRLELWMQADAKRVHRRIEAVKNIFNI